MIRARVNFGDDQSDVTIRRTFAVPRDERTKSPSRAPVVGAVYSTLAAFRDAQLSPVKLPRDRPRVGGCARSGTGAHNVGVGGEFTLRGEPGQRIPGRTATSKISWTTPSKRSTPTMAPVVVSTIQTPQLRPSAVRMMGRSVKTDSRT